MPDDLSKLTRDELNEQASEAGIENPETLPNKAAVLDALAEGAPKTETPEDPAPAPVERADPSPPMETPENPALPEEARRVFGLTAPPQVLPVPGGSAPTTYLSTNPNGDAATTYDIDTTVGSAPADRPSTFSPPGTGHTITPPTAGAPTPGVGQDYGTATQMAGRPSVVDPALTTQVSIDLGLQRFG